MANVHGRLNRLAKIYASRSVSERERLAEIYESYVQIEREWGWPEGTTVAIMNALLTDTSHEFAYYDADGNRTVHRIGPFFRDARGEIRWGREPAAIVLAVLHERLDYQESYADGIPSWDISARLPDGSWFDARWLRWKHPPSARRLREMVVEQARTRDELALLERAVGAVAVWLDAVPRDRAVAGSS
jgi:hypothetical protein